VLTLVARHSHEQDIKKSRFIAIATRVECPIEALEWLESVVDPEATHNCWAYRIGDLYRSSDDGEPSGTAGRPILSAIDSQGLDQVMVVVIRYFGGIKLGAGGLARAYGGTAAQCLRAARRVEILRKAMVTVEIPFDFIGTVYPVLDRFGAVKCMEKYNESGVILKMEVDERYVADLTSALLDATRGIAVIETI
jgi:uncharacterized YigZ family protein